MLFSDLFIDRLLQGEKTLEPQLTSCRKPKRAGARTTVTGCVMSSETRFCGFLCLMDEDLSASFRIWASVPIPASPRKRPFVQGYFLTSHVHRNVGNRDRSDTRLRHRQTLSHPKDFILNGCTKTTLLENILTF